jgi:hypothetical protein
MGVFRSVSNVAAVAALTCLSACATVTAVDDPSILSEATLSVVTASEAGHGGGPRGISDRFGTDGVVYAFVSIVWPADHKAWGHQIFESRWYSGDRLVVQRNVTLQISKSPFNFWSNVFPVNLGPGPARYEVYANGKKLAEKSFIVVAPTAPTHSGLMKPQSAS